MTIRFTSAFLAIAMIGAASAASAAARVHHHKSAVGSAAVATSLSADAASPAMTPRETETDKLMYDRITELGD